MPNGSWRTASGEHSSAGEREVNRTVDELLARSHRLGADRRNTNYAGGNASAKGVETDPASGHDVELLWVKGSGGDLATLTESGLAVLRLDRLRSLRDVYKGPEHEDEMVGAMEYCLHGRGGAVPSIDTAMHALVEAVHVDHLHPDSAIAIATSQDGEQLTKTIYGDKVLWVPWRRPGFQLGLDVADLKRQNPAAVGVILGGHGITAWGDSSDDAEANSLWIIQQAQAYIDRQGVAEPFGPAAPGRRPLAPVQRRRLAAALAPHLRAVASSDQPVIGHFCDDEVVLEFLAGEKLARLAGLGTSCPDHFLRTKVRPLVLDVPPTSSLDAYVQRLHSLHLDYRAQYEAYYRRHADEATPAMRGSDPAIILVPAVGLFAFGRDKQTARVSAEFYLNAINVMRGAETISTYEPIDESEKFRVEYWGLEEAKLRRLPPRARTTAGWPWSPARPAASEGPSPSPSPRGVRVSSWPTSMARRRDSPLRISGAMTPPSGWRWTSPRSRTSRRPSRLRSSVSAASISWSTAPAFRFPSPCWKRPRRIGTCSTTSWPRAASSCPRPLPAR